MCERHSYVLYIPSLGRLSKQLTSAIRLWIFEICILMQVRRITHIRYAGSGQSTAFSGIIFASEVHTNKRNAALLSGLFWLFTILCHI